MSSATTTRHQEQATAGTGSRAVSRTVLLAATWLFAGLIGLQVFFAGMFLMYDGDYFSAHQGLGWLMTYVPWVTLVVAAFARPGRGFWLSLVALFVLVQVQPFLALIPPDESTAWLRALHVPNAMLITLLAFQQAAEARRLRRPGTAA